MNLTTTYLGLRLANPFMPGASPLADDMEMALSLEDAGAGAIVLRSLFEEQVISQRYGFDAVAEQLRDNPEALSYFPARAEFALSPHRYLEHLRRLKERIAVPVIGSLNGVTPEGWLEYARLIEQAGADALELNFYHVATDAYETAALVENCLFDIVVVLKESIRIPLAVKLSPFFSALPNLATRLASLGVDGLVLFNKFYEPDLDPDELEAVPRLQLSDSSDLRLRLQWLSILRAQFPASLAVSGGVHDPLDAVKAILAGADGVQVVSTLIRRGIPYLGGLIRGVDEWSDRHGYESLDDLRGRLSIAKSPDARAFQRGNYLRILQSWRPPDAGHPRGILRGSRS